MIDSKLINVKTNSIVSHFVNGFEHSVIHEGHEKTYAKKSPDEIVNHSFIEIGNSLKGATEAARKELKRKYKQTPVVLCPRKNIALIKCRSTDPYGCVWLVESKIKDIFPYPNNQTLVVMKDGFTIIVDMKCKELQRNREKASYLCKTFLDNNSNLDDLTVTDINHQPITENKRLIIKTRKTKVEIKKPILIK